jgi:hypothetical protein
VRLELLLLCPRHFLQDNRSHERIGALGLEEPKPPKLGAIGRPEENEIGERGIRRPFDPQPIRVGGGSEVAQNGYDLTSSGG